MQILDNNTDYMILVGLLLFGVYIVALSRLFIGDEMESFTWLDRIDFDKMSDWLVVKRKRDAWKVPFHLPLIILAVLLFALTVVLCPLLVAIAWLLQLIKWYRALPD